jgi:hypothetical protein
MIARFEVDWLKAHNEARVAFARAYVWIVLPQTSGIMTLSFIQKEYPHPHWQDDIENGQWLGLLHTFTAVKDFYISTAFVPGIASALQELVGERVARSANCFLEGATSIGTCRKHYGAVCFRTTACQ